MLRTFTRTAPALRKYFVTRTTFNLVRTMASNEDLKSSKLFDVSHVTAVVTGGGTGIGLMITQALVANGAKVYIVGRREEAVNKVADQYNTGPGKIIAYVISDLHGGWSLYDSDWPSIQNDSRCQQERRGPTPG